MKNNYFWLGSIGLPITAILLNFLFSSISVFRYLSVVSLAFVFFFSIIIIFRIIENYRIGRSILVSFLFVLSATLTTILMAVLFTNRYCEYNGGDMCGLIPIIIIVYIFGSFLLAGILALILKTPFKLLSEKLGSRSLLIFADVFVICVVLFLMMFISAYSSEYNLRNSESMGYTTDIALHDALNVSIILAGVAYVITLILLFFYYFIRLRKQKLYSNKVKKVSLYFAASFTITSILVSYVVGYLIKSPIQKLINFVLIIIVLLSLIIFYGLKRTNNIYFK